MTVIRNSTAATRWMIPRISKPRSHPKKNFEMNPWSKREREARDHEDDEGGRQHRVLPDLVGLHPADLGTAAEEVPELAPQIDQPVQQHPADDHHDRDDVDLLDERGQRRAQPLAGDAVDRDARDLGRDLGVALAARCAGGSPG